MVLVITTLGEKMGVEYLYSQTGKNWSSDVSRLDPDEPDQLTDELTNDSLDEGFEESEEVDPTVGDLHLGAISFRPAPLKCNHWYFTQLKFMLICDYLSYKTVFPLNSLF